MERVTEQLKYGFKFEKFEEKSAVAEYLLPDFDDSAWQEVRVPHDWAIQADFEKLCDAKEATIKEDGVVKPILHTGRTGALPSIGKGVYRKWIEIPAADSDRKIFLECDGIMWRSEIYLNGILCGKNHFGYKSFQVDLTDAVKFGEPNLLAIVAIVDTDCSRWYTGGGIYRNLRLVKKPAQHLPYNGIWVRQLAAGPQVAVFELSVEIKGGYHAQIFAPDGTPVQEFDSDSNSMIFELENPVLWDLDNPVLYTVKVRINSGDTETVAFGPRSSRFTTDGYFLNGRHIKLNGVCMHHDLGSLGAAINLAAMRRQLTILKEMGVNALRTSHNPPAPELLTLCDEMGILVMDEFFDEWATRKVSNGYTKYFNDHAVEDMTDVIKRDRNHPSVILWSTGNEMREQWRDDGWKVTKMLTDAVHTIDPTRPVTAGLSAMPHALEKHQAFYLDVASFNYKPHLYKEIHERFPDLILLGSETASCVSTRGVYHLPAQVEIPVTPKEDLACSAYELTAPNWAYYAERELAAQRDCPYVAGEFIWTGFDYLGEPTPYYCEWPSRSSYFGVLDLAGLPKNRFFGYKAAWTDQPVLHLFPHWNWEGDEGKNVPVHLYTNFPCAELFINGVSQGKQYLDDTDEIRRFRMIWPDTVYAPGEVVAVAYDQEGKEAMRTAVKTAGAPYAITLTADRTELTADGDDLAYVTAAIVDRDGNLCPTAAHRLTFEVTGAGEFLTTDAGDQRETESFARPDKKALSGMLVACVRTLQQAGTITVACTGEGLQKATLQIKSN